MSVDRVRALAAALACAMIVAGCATAPGDGDPATTGSLDANATLADGEADPRTAVLPGGPVAGDPNSDLNLGKRHYREKNYGLAEKHFRRAVEASPGPVEHDTEAWLGLAASYDQLRRFELADRAYAQAIKLVGRTPEVLNNQGYSFMMRGDFARARKTLAEAQAKDPESPFIKNNIELLNRTARR